MTDIYARLDELRSGDEAILHYDPWAGDRDDDSRTLRDKMVITRKPSFCAICFETIPVRSRIRAQTQQSRQQRKVMTFKFCPACCKAMAVAADDDGPINDRFAIGMAAARNK